MIKYNKIMENIIQNYVQCHIIFFFKKITLYKSFLSSFKIYNTIILYIRHYIYMIYIRHIYIITFIKYIMLYIINNIIYYIYNIMYIIKILYNKNI